MKTSFVEGKPLHTIFTPLAVGNEDFSISGAGSLYAQAKHIAEGFTNLFKPELFTEAGARLTSLFAEAPHTSTLVGIDSQVSLWLSRINYIKLSVVQVYRPAGLTVSYLEYIDTLERAFDFTCDIEAELIGTVESSVMNYLNNPSTLTASTVPRSKNKYFTTKVDKFGEPIGECFDPTERSDKYAFTEAFHRNLDYDPAMVRMNRLKTRMDAISTKQLTKRIDNIFKMVDELANNIRNVEHYKQMTKPVATRLAEDIACCAVWVEFFAVLMRQILVMSVAMDDTNKHLKKLTSNKSL